MPFAVSVADDRRWLVVEYEGAVDSAELVASRRAAAEANAEGGMRDFILDFSGVREFVLDPEGVAGLRDIDEVRVRAVPSGRCAIVGVRPVVVEGLTLLGAVSVMDLDFRLIPSRADAEAWLRGTLAYEPPRPPRRR